VRASRLTKHRIRRVWGRSLLCRSLGLAPACTVTGSVSAGALPSPCAAWGRIITALRPLGGLRKLRSNREVLAAFAPVCWGNLRSASRRGLRALARKLAVCSGKQRIAESVHGAQAFFNQQSNFIKE
jgi:hypothetical protein